MKVLNYTTSYFAVVLLLLISVWAAVFYYAMLDEIYDSIDDGLDNQKGLILQKVATDSTILRKSNFEEGDYALKEISADAGRNFQDASIDTMMYMQNEKSFEPVRLLRTAFQHNGKYYQMLVVTSMVEEDDLIAELFYALLWLYIGLVASILILNNVLLKRIWRPFYHLLKQIKNFRLERPTVVEVTQTGIDEFKLLNETIQKLLQSNIDSYTSQKHFIENAAHELQTPLAISINKLESLAELGKFSEEQVNMLSSALNHLERLNRLNKSLLLLSKIENKQFLKGEEININTLAKRVVNDFSDQLSYSKLEWHIQEEETATLHMNPDLALVLITNLVKNAIVHNHPGGMIHIIIRKDTFIISNTGKGEVLAEQYLFSRFNKDLPSENSTGLGLAIVKAIADLYSFRIAYSYSSHHVFSLYFK